MANLENASRERVKQILEDASRIRRRQIPAHEGLGYNAESQAEQELRERGKSL